MADQGSLANREPQGHRQLEATHDQEQVQAFLHIVAHDLKSPLTNILGYAQLGQRIRGRLAVAGGAADSQERLRDALDKIVLNCRRLQRLVDDLQEAFQIGTGRFDIHREPVDLGALVHQMVDESQDVAPSRQFVVSVPPTPVRGDWDTERLRQLVANLLSNAVKYSPEGGPITVSLRQRGQEAILSVTDNGLGIPAGDLDALFQPYSRLHRSRAMKGTGLGLYVVKGIVDAHGGTVRGESAGEGQGATFTVTLPLHPPENALSAR